MLSCDQIKAKADQASVTAYFSGKDGPAAQVFIDLLSKTTSTFARVEEEGCAASVGHKDGEIVLFKPDENGELPVFTDEVSADNILLWMSKNILKAGEVFNFDSNEA